MRSAASGRLAGRVVDDDPRFRALARMLLGRLGYVIVAEAADGAQALALALARQVREIDSSLRILLTSTDPTLVAPAKLADGAAVAFVPKDGLAITALAPLLGD